MHLDLAGEPHDLPDSTAARSTWRRASFCAPSTCVEIAMPGDRVLVRDSKDPAARAVLEYTQDEWRAFVLGVKAGEFDV